MTSPRDFWVTAGGYYKVKRFIAVVTDTKSKDSFRSKPTLFIIMIIVQYLICPQDQRSGALLIPYDQLRSDQ
jgi:hypothetical protein